MRKWTRLDEKQKKIVDAKKHRVKSMFWEKNEIACGPAKTRGSGVIE